MPVPLRRTGRLTIDELCAAYDNEDVHTEHVTALALRLFDQTRAALDLPADGRRLLEAASRLHDVGYSIDPVHHVQASAEIVMEEGIKGFSRAECERIIQIMVCHSGKISTKGVPSSILQLAAFLRVGDGLDYGHAQTARITSIHRAQRTIRVTVRSDAFPQCLARADRKADVWRAVFPYDIQFEAAPATTTDGDPLVRSNMHVIEAARRLLWIQFKTILANLDARSRGKQANHCMTSASPCRRMRTFSGCFASTCRTGHGRKSRSCWTTISEELGPVRDLDEWVDLLGSRGPIRWLRGAGYSPRTWATISNSVSLSMRRCAAVCAGRILPASDSGSTGCCARNCRD